MSAATEDKERTRQARIAARAAEVEYFPKFEVGEFVRFMFSKRLDYGTAYIIERPSRRNGYYEVFLGSADEYLRMTMWRVSVANDKRFWLAKEEELSR